MPHRFFFFKGDVPAWPMEMYFIVPILSVQIVVGQCLVYTGIKSKLNCDIHYSSPAPQLPVKNKSLLLANDLYSICLEDSPIEGHDVYVQRTSPMGHYSVHVATCIYVQ